MINQEALLESLGGPMQRYLLYSDTLVDMVISITKNVKVGSLLELAPPGKITA